VDEFPCRCCGNPEPSFLFNDGHCDICLPEASEYDPPPRCDECGSMLRLVEDKRPWNTGNYAEWCPLCGYRDRAAP
jgi:hypothetical protein